MHPYYIVKTNSEDYLKMLRSLKNGIFGMDAVTLWTYETQRLVMKLGQMFLNGRIWDTGNRSTVLGRYRCLLTLFEISSQK
jgi:hypothetical protein